MRSRSITALLLAFLCGWGFAESLEEKIKATDQTNADAVFELAKWCSENNLPTKARAYYRQVIKLNPDHEGARSALGQIKVGERWILAPAERTAKPSPAATEGAQPAGPVRRASGAPPTAEQIPWDLTLPKDPEPQHTWINQYIDKLPAIGNDSDDMGVAVATMLQEEQIDRVIPRLCRKLTEPTFTDLYGASDLANELMRTGRLRKARILLPFLMKASERIDEPGDLANFAFAVGQMKDKRVVPRLIQLLESPSAEAQEGAANGLQMVTLLPLEDLTPERVKQWWALNHNVSDQQIYQEQLRSSDPRIAVEAAKALYEFRDRSIIPVLAKLMRGDNRLIGTEAVALVKRITGNDWTYNPEAPADQRKKRADELEKWWKEEEFRFIWIEDRGKPKDDKVPVASQDPAVEWVKQLGSAIAAQATTAEANLVGAGSKAVVALIGGLGDSNRLVQRKCQELLERITKQKLPFSPSASDEVRAAQVADWKSWAAGQGLMAAEPSED